MNRKEYNTKIQEKISRGFRHAPRYLNRPEILKVGDLSFYLDFPGFGGFFPIDVDGLPGGFELDENNRVIRFNGTVYHVKLSQNLLTVMDIIRLADLPKPCQECGNTTHPVWCPSCGMEGVKEGRPDPLPND